MERIEKAILADASLDEATPKRRPENPVDHWAPAVLLERAAYLRRMAKYGNGSASETLKEYPQHLAMLSYRSRSGEVEVHEQFADLFLVLAGSATLVTGGTVEGARTVGRGEIRGQSIAGGTRQQLSVGDLAHVPSGVPHQMILKGEETIACLVMKVQEALELDLPKGAPAGKQTPAGR